MMRRQFGLACLALAAGPVPALAAERPAGVLYKNPQCSCCEAHAEYLRQHGYRVEVKPSFDLVAIKRQNGVPEALDGCHTMLIGGYVVEGHVPVAPSTACSTSARRSGASRSPACRRARPGCWRRARASGRSPSTRSPPTRRRARRRRCSASCEAQAGRRRCGPWACSACWSAWPCSSLRRRWSGTSPRSPPTATMALHPVLRPHPLRG